MKYTVDGLGAVLQGLSDIDVDVKTMRKELRPAATVLRSHLRDETPKKSRNLLQTVRSSVSRLKITAGVGSRMRPYAKWNQWGKKSPNKRFAERALYPAARKIEPIIGAAIERIIINHRMSG